MSATVNQQNRGAFFSGFFLIHVLGHRNCLWLAGSLSVTVGVAAMWIAGSATGSGHSKAKKKPTVKRSQHLLLSLFHRTAAH